jgi:hypothetical protein
MDVSTLLSLGFEVTGGMIDRLGKNYGVLTKEGPSLTADGRELAARLASAQEPKRTRKKVDVVEDTAPTPDEAAIDALLKG